ncbi:MAG: hypothetical protein ACI8RZ_003516 [Myxococcota bacterium]|jgi:hypothetical protein
MADEQRCEECLELPGGDGTCSGHPYARLIWISPEDAREEQALMKSFGQARRKSVVILIGVALVLFLFLGMISGPGGRIFGLLLVLLMLGLGGGVLHLPAALMWSRGWKMRTGASGLPVWLLTILGTVLSVVLSLSTVVLLDALHVLRVSEWNLAIGPVTVWLLGAGSLLLGMRVKRKERAVLLADVAPLDALEESARVQRPQRQPKKH